MDAQITRAAPGRRIWSGSLFVIGLVGLLASSIAPHLFAAPSNTNFILQWQASELTDTQSIAWGDVNGDGRADLALGNAPIFDADCNCLVGGENQLYLSEGALLQNDPIWESESAEFTTGIALEDIDGDGKRDLISADAFAGLNIYRNSDGSLPTTPSWTSASLLVPTPPAVPYRTSENVRAIALADYDKDGDLDIAIANSNAPLRLFRNDSSVGNIVFTLVWSSATSDYSNDVAWGDVDGDGDLDLAVANEGISHLYLNNSGTLGSAIAINSEGFKALSVAWGDLNLDGFADLALGALGQSVVYYGSAAGTLSAAFFWPGGANEQVRDVAFANIDGDERPELLYTNFGLPNSLGIYSAVLSEGDLTPQTYWAETDANVFRSLALADYDSDGDLDLAVGSANQPVRVYRNTVRESGANVVVTLDGAAAAGAYVYRRTSDGSFQPFSDQESGSLVQTDAAGIARIGRQLALNDEIVVLLPVFERNVYRSSGPALPISADGTPVITSSLTVTRSGLIRDLQVVNIIGEHGWLGDLVFTLISPQGTRVEIFRNDCTPPGNEPSYPFHISLSDNATKTALVPQPAGSTTLGPCPPHTEEVLLRPRNPLAAFNGEKAQGTWQLVVNDIYNQEGGALTGWELALGTADYPLYYTNARPLANDISGTRVTAFEQQNIALSSAADAAGTFPLLLFDLSVSLEWDARNDPSYMSQLKADLRRASELLYDFSDGQVALRTITIYQNRERWADADVRIHATNRQRPNADQGGVTTVPYADDEVDDIIYYPGWINMGAVWNRYGNETGTIGEDWPRSLAHELGHFLLYLDDNYIGLAGEATEANLVAIDPPCSGAMFDPYRDEYTEFMPRASWEPTCTLTLSNYFTGRADWETIRLFYPELREPADYGANPGPTRQSLAVTIIEEMTPSAPLTTLDNTVFSLVNSQGGRVVPGSNTQAYLFPQGGERLVDLGRPIVDQVDARGTRPGDELCVYELNHQPAPRLGCLRVGNESGVLTLGERSGWRPDVRITPLSATTISMTVLTAGLGSPAPGELRARFYPAGQAATGVQTLSAKNGSYQATFAVSKTIETGYVRLWVEENASPRREIIIDYSQLGQPPFGSTTTNGPTLQDECEEDNRDCTKKKKKKNAPASADGQALLYFNDQLVPDNYYSLQGTTVLPPPPPWATIVGRGYRFVTAPGSQQAPRASINFAYLEREVPAGTEGGLTIYYFDEQFKSWIELETTRYDPTRNEIATTLVGDGLYVLLTRLPVQNGWNLLAYPWTDAVEVEAGLGAINAQGFTTIYEYNAGGSWLLYDIDAPAYVNTLTQLEYGKGYWIKVEDVATLAEAATADASLPLPPATYYGSVTGLNGVKPTAGATVEARIGEKVCGTSTTQEYPANSGKIVFAVSVFADDGAQWAGCGVPGRTVSFRIGTVELPYRALWNNGRPQELRLTYLPIVR